MTCTVLNDYSFWTETEKYAHVTFFFNGGVEKQFERETRFMVPSPKVATYDLKPEMSAAGVAEEVFFLSLNLQFFFLVGRYGLSHFCDY